MLQRWFKKLLDRTRLTRRWVVRHARLFYGLSLIGFGFELAIRLMFELNIFVSGFVGGMMLLTFYQMITLKRTSQATLIEKGLFWGYLIWLICGIVRMILVCSLPLSLIGQPYMGFFTGIILILFFIGMTYLLIHGVGTIFMMLIQYTLIHEKEISSSSEKLETNEQRDETNDVVLTKKE